MLNINESSSIAEIKSSYRKAAAQFHPDSNSGQADTEKFQLIVQAYNMILDSRKNGKPLIGKSWLGRLFSDSKERILRLVHGGATPQQQWAQSFARQGYWSTLNMLIRKVDLAETEEERIKAARTVFRLYRSSFPAVAIPRLASSDGSFRMELIKMLALTCDQQGLEAITSYLFCGEMETMLTAYVSLELAGPAGHTAAAKALGLNNSFFHRMLDYLATSEDTTNNYRAPASQIRRIRKFSRQCGAPMSKIMSRMGYVLGHSA